MEHETSNITAQKAAEVLRQLGLAHVLTAIILFSSLVLYFRSPKPQKQNTFPPWAIIEIALTSLIVSRGGVLERI